MKKLLLLVFLETQAIWCQAQVSVIMNAPAATELSLNSLINIQVINSSQNSYHTDIIGSLTLPNAQAVYQVQFRTVDILPGINRFSTSSLDISNETFGNNQQAQKLHDTRLVPYGSYDLCVYINDASTGDQLTFSCLEQEFGPNSPPQLLSPANEEEISTTHPLLVWIPPSPVQQNLQVQYDLKLVEILNDESPYDALVRNPVLLYQTGIAATSLLYPANAFPLDTGKRYAWQVIAKSDGNSLGETEVWSFTIGTPKFQKETEKTSSGSYYKLKKHLDGSFAQVGETLRFEYENPYDSSELNYRITDLYGKDFTPESVHPQKKYGSNFYEMSLKKARLKSGQYYLLEVYSSKNQKQVMLFKYDRRNNRP